MIAKNEERWIGECLEHLKPLASELIVIDTGSTDRTMEIAREKGARVSQIKWEGDFAKARNASLEKATQRWILVIDPDERIGSKDFAQIKQLCEAKGVMAYSFDTRNYSENASASGFKPCRGEYPEEKNYPGYFESRKVRLFQNIPTIRFVGSVHELVESTISGKTEESSIPFHHYGSSKVIEAEKGKQQFYQKQGIKKIQENPSDWKSHFELGIEYIGAGEFKKAIDQLEKARALKPRDPLVLSNLGYAYMEGGKLGQAESTLSECLKIDDKYHDALLNLGVTKMRGKKWTEALPFFDACTKSHPKSFLAFRNAGLAWAHLKKYKAAAKCLEHSLKLFPQYTEARIDLALTCVAGGRPDLAQKLLEQAVKENPQSLRARAVLDEIKKGASENRSPSQQR